MWKCAKRRWGLLSTVVSGASSVPLLLSRCSGEPGRGEAGDVSATLAAIDLAIADRTTPSGSTSSRWPHCCRVARSSRSQGASRTTARPGVGRPTLDSVIDACYFSVMTFTATGYGDYVPSPGLGQILAAVQALTGVFLMALLLVCLARRYGRA